MAAAGAARDFVGYGGQPPHPRWPGDARIAININLNYEAGGESSVLEGDAGSEQMLTDIGVPSYRGMRSPLAESIFEYGSRCGVWRLLRIFERFEVKVSVLGVVRALESNPAVTRAFVAAGHEIVSHGYRWIDYHEVDEATEREHIRCAVAGLERLTGARPLGWMTGRPGPNTRRLLVEAGGFLYDRDALNDELPYWVKVAGRDHLVVPYSYETNDNRFDLNRGFATAEDCFQYFRDCFDLLYEEGAEQPKLMSIGLHDRLIGRPGRAVALIRFLEHVRRHPRVWFCRGVDVAEHWRQHFPPPERSP
ncbi:MAG TPA: polysaccharide deacetylase family protein [Stellaceae bacterium]|nr:polysaccharide deacetylase family protein [Stellaceae bacterium]